MAKRTLSVTQVKMYESMVEADFAELMDLVQAYRTALSEQARVEVAKSTGLYELKMMEKKIELQLEETRKKIRNIEGNSRWDKNKDFEAAIRRKVSQLLGGVGNGALANIEATHEFFLRKVRLAGVTDEVKEVFETMLPNKIQELTKAVKLLPPPPKPNKNEIKLLEEE